MGLTQIKNSLETQVGSPVAFSSVIIRVMLKTGVNLKEIKPDQDKDPVTITKVKTFVGTLGYQV